LDCKNPVGAGPERLWAPWRIGYIQDIGPTSAGIGHKGCFLCHNFQHPDDDQQNLVLWRTKHGLVVLNRFPYNNGHLLIAPARHIADLTEATDDELLEMTKLIRESQKALTLAMNPQGFNVGMNFGRCGGAGLPGHLHIHVVPRWQGDTNFMSVCCDTKVISQSLGELLSELQRVTKEHNLPCLAKDV
jgi:ATP adenylyltransferase